MFDFTFLRSVISFFLDVGFRLDQIFTFMFLRCLASTSLYDSHELVLGHKSNQSGAIAFQTTFTFGNNPGVIDKMAEIKFVENRSPVGGKPAGLKSRRDGRRSSRKWLG
jgi:hypothetical protein